jgi:hypothetical protein
MYQYNPTHPGGEPLKDRLAPITLRSEALFKPSPEVDCPTLFGEEGLPDPSPEDTSGLLGLFLLDDRGRLLYLNRFARRFFEQVCGRWWAELLGQNFWQQCPEVADSVFAREYRQALAEQRTLDLAVFYPALGRWFLFHAPLCEDVRCIFVLDAADRVRLERGFYLLREQVAAVEEQNG